MSVTKLPIFKGYTVDLQRQEFRKAKPGSKPVKIHFLSLKGEKIFAELEKFAIEVVEYYDYK
jgi:hypothetical protein